jgi:hypothetical protein
MTTIDGLPDGTYTMYTSDNSGKRLDKPGTYEVKNGRLEVPLSADSINTLKMNGYKTIKNMQRG